MAAATPAGVPPPTRSGHGLDSRRARRVTAASAALAAAGLYAVYMVLRAPYRDVFAFDPDEGLNAILVLLVDRGHPLYTQSWYNQPPLLTQLLRVWFAAFGWEIDTGRMLILLFAAVCVFALYDMVRLIAGHGAAALACLLLATSAFFPRLSVALMQAVPSLALAALALWALVRWQASARGAWIAAAGVLMGCSVACKLTSAVLVPALAVWLVACAPAGAARRRSWRAARDWLVCTAMTSAVLLLLFVGPAQLHILVDAHLAARRAPQLMRFDARGLVLTSFAEWPLTVLGLGGYALILYSRLRLAAVFPLWAGVATVAMLNHAPIWYHHQLLLSFPHCAAGGIAVAELLRRDSSAARLPPRALGAMRIGAVALVAALPLWSAFGARLPAPIPLAGAQLRVLAAMRERAPTTRVVVTNDPMYAFRAGFGVPPAIAALPLLRVATDPDLADEIRAAFAEHAPEQVVLTPRAAPELLAWITDAMGDRYRLVLDEERTQLYVLADGRAGARPKEDLTTD